MAVMTLSSPGNAGSAEEGIGSGAQYLRYLLAAACLRWRGWGLTPQPLDLCPLSTLPMLLPYVLRSAADCFRVMAAWGLALGCLTAAAGGWGPLVPVRGPSSASKGTEH